MSEEYRGTLEPLLQAARDRYSPTEGLIRELEYRGFSEARIRNLAQSFVNSGMAVDIDVVHGVASLSAQDNSGSFTLDVWEIIVNQTNPTIFENPVVVNTLSPAQIFIIRFALEKGLSPADAVDAFNADANLKTMYNGGSDITWPSSTYATRLYDRAIKGKTEYLNYDYTLRHTTNVSNRWNVNIADIGVNMLYATADLLTEVQNTDYWVFPLPGRLVYKINAIPVPVVPDGYLWSWLKSASSESTAANNRVNIVTEYYLQAWTTDLYDVY